MSSESPKNLLQVHGPFQFEYTLNSYLICHNSLICHKMGSL